MATVHRLARKELAAIGLPRPISHYRHEVTERLFTNRFASGLSQYPCPSPFYLQELYACHINAKNNGAQISADNILFTSGSFIGIDLLIRAFCSPSQDSICTLTPTFGGYKHYAHINQINVIEISLSGENYDQINTEDIPFDESRLLFLCLPNNPISTSLHRQFVECILVKAEGLVVIDEAYIELADSPSWVGYLKQYPNLVILRTFSKAWGLAGIRAGAVIASPVILNALRIIQDPFCLSTPAQMALKSAMEDIESVEQSVIKIKAARTLLQQKLYQFKFIKKVYESQTNFMLAQVTDNFHSFITKNLSNCLIENGPKEVPYSIKITVGNEIENIELLNLLNEYENQ